MNNLILVFQIILSLLLITLIVLQPKGTGLGRQFSSSNYHAKRGMEKTIYYATILTALIFLTLSVNIAF